MHILNDRPAGWASVYISYTIHTLLLMQGATYGPPRHQKYSMRGAIQIPATPASPTFIRTEHSGQGGEGYSRSALKSNSSLRTIPWSENMREKQEASLSRAIFRIPAIGRENITAALVRLFLSTLVP
jgi:hypothetical protein